MTSDVAYLTTELTEDLHANEGGQMNIKEDQRGLQTSSWDSTEDAGTCFDV